MLGKRRGDYAGKRRGECAAALGKLMLGKRREALCPASGAESARPAIGKLMLCKRRVVGVMPGKLHEKRARKLA